MQERIDPASNPGMGDGNGNLMPSCVRAAVGESEPATAYPPRRIVELARSFGQYGIVQSICQDDFGPAMTAIINVIADNIVRSCLPRPLVRKKDGTVACNVVWELPPPNAALSGTPSHCNERGYLGPVDPGRAPQNDRSGENCKVSQLPVTDLSMGTLPVGDGWYYDDFSPELARLCNASEPQRIAFTQGARPPNGVIVKRECLNETQRVEETRSDVTPGYVPPSIGSACGGEVGSNAPTGDAACRVQLANGTVDDSLFCHPELNVCMKACSSSRDCPPAWECDARPESLVASQGRAFCVNPVCAMGIGE